MKRSTVYALGLAFAVACSPGLAQTDPSPSDDLAASGLGNVPGCDPSVESAIVQNAQQGTTSSLGRIRNSYSTPQSLLGLSCLDNVLNAAHLTDLSFNLSSALSALLNQVQNFACSALQNEVASVAAPFNASSFFAAIPSVPGLSETPVTLTTPTSSGISTPSTVVPSTSTPGTTTITPAQPPADGSGGSSSSPLLNLMGGG